MAPRPPPTRSFGLPLGMISRAKSSQCWPAMIQTHRTGSWVKTSPNSVTLERPSVPSLHHRFAHAANDKLRLEWQEKNSHLRPYAYGYPITSAYNRSDVTLYDEIGMDAHNGAPAPARRS